MHKKLWGWLLLPQRTSHECPEIAPNKPLTQAAYNAQIRSLTKDPLWECCDCVLESCVDISIKCYSVAIVHCLSEALMSSQDSSCRGRFSFTQGPAGTVSDATVTQRLLIYVWSLFRLLCSYEPPVKFKFTGSVPPVPTYLQCLLLPSKRTLEIFSPRKRSGVSYKIKTTFLHQQNMFA